MFLRHPALFVAGLSIVFGTSTPATWADPAAGEDPVSPQMAITIRYPTASTHQVCWTGQLRGTPPANPTWVIVTVGVRAPGLPILDGPLVYSGTTASDCFTVHKDSALAGVYTTTFSYLGTGPDIPSDITAVGLWTGTQNNKIEASQ